MFMSLDRLISLEEGEIGEISFLLFRGEDKAPPLPNSNTEAWLIFSNLVILSCTLFLVLTEFVIIIGEVNLPLCCLFLLMLPVLPDMLNILDTLEIFPP